MFRSAKDGQTHDTSVRYAVGPADAHFDWTNTRETSITRVAKLPSPTPAKNWSESQETSDSDGLSDVRSTRQRREKTVKNTETSVR